VVVEGITLFALGGVARTASEPSSPGGEFLIAGVGPLASVGLAVAFAGAAALAEALGAGLGAQVVLEYLAILNLALAIFNLLPGFPLDGGRLLRAALWKGTGSFRRATRTATVGGRILGWAILGLGLYLFFAERDRIGGLWLVFVGWFLSNAARMTWERLLLDEILRPLTAGEAMSPDPESVPPDLPLDRLVQEFFLRRPYNAFPVTEGAVAVGLVSLGQVKRVEREEWSSRRVLDIMSALDDTLVVTPDTPMREVLSRMRGADSRRALVAENGRLRGIISATDIARWLDRVGLIEG
jgi:CBS domain-containing protein